MKKIWLALGLTLILTAWGGQGYHGFGAMPAWGQPPPYSPPPYYNPYYYPPPYDYYNYYSSPYADPLSQFLFYLAPQVRGEDWEHRRKKYYERQKHLRKGFKPRGRGHEHDD